MNRYSSFSKSSIELPAPSADALAHSTQLAQVIHEHIQQSAQYAISFEQYMQLALYAPGFGYYAVGTEKFGQAGDFITAPEISPLFGNCIAHQCVEVFNELSSDKNILELGAGSGKLAKAILEHLDEMAQLPTGYFILEVSPDLKAKQKQFLSQHLSPKLFEKCQWLETLPHEFSGFVLANEVLDALAVKRFVWTEKNCYEIFVATNESGFVEKLSPADKELVDEILALHEKYGYEWPDNYSSEINQQMSGLLRSLAHMLKKGMLLLIDYGFPANEFYHPQRNKGTLVCHYRHHVHNDPYFLPGLQDITSHVDFTRAAEVATEAGLEVSGFTTQAGFLLGSGLLENVSEDLATQLKLNQQIQLLTSPAEMGELFKVLALNKNCAVPLLTVDFFVRSL